jgi:hypothetical protein
MCSLSTKICLSKTQNLPAGRLLDCFLSPCMMLLRCIPVITYTSIHSFCCCLLFQWVDINHLIIHCPKWWTFRALSSRKHWYKKTMQVLWMYVSISLEHIPTGGIARSLGGLCLPLEETAKLLSNLCNTLLSCQQFMRLPGVPPLLPELSVINLNFSCAYKFTL